MQTVFIHSSTWRQEPSAGWTGAFSAEGPYPSDEQVRDLNEGQAGKHFIETDSMELNNASTPIET
jgi:hypothetical protein